MGTSTRVSSGLRPFSRGFTIIELLVVVAIIGLLASFTLYAVTGARNKARYQQAFTNAKGIQQAAQLCVADNSTICLPGQTTLGCGASATLDTIDGGTALICTSRNFRYVALPTGWVWCDANAGTGACSTGATASNLTSPAPFALKMKRTADNVVVTCTETGCVCSGTNCPAY